LNSKENAMGGNVCVDFVDTRTIGIKNPNVFIFNGKENNGKNNRILNLDLECINSHLIESLI